jgi:hypothetical protein
MSHYFPLSYWIIVGVYAFAVLGILYVARKRSDCFSCSVAAGLRRSALLAILITPSVIPGWVLVPVPASLLFLMFSWSTAVGVEEFTLNFFFYIAGVLCVLPILLVTIIIFVTWIAARILTHQSHTNTT